MPGPNSNMGGPGERAKGKVTEQVSVDPDLDLDEHFPTLAESSRAGGKKNNEEGNGATTVENAWRRDGRNLFGGNRTRQPQAQISPYLDNVDPKWGCNTSDEELWQMFRDTGRVDDDAEIFNAKILDWTAEDTMLLKVRKDQLLESGIILHIPDRFPLRDEIESWAEADLRRKFNIRLVQLKLVGKQKWLMVVENRDQRNRLLQNSPLDWGREQVEVLPWTPDFNPSQELSKRIATWVEIPLADAWLEPLGDKFLRAIGKPTFKTLNRGTCKYPNIRGKSNTRELQTHVSGAKRMAMKRGTAPTEGETLEQKTEVRSTSKPPNQMLSLKLISRNFNRLLPRQGRLGPSNLRSWGYEVIPTNSQALAEWYLAQKPSHDNILSLRLGQEWAQITNQDVIFVKLDFMKAYDRVAHRFLWDTLAAMGMGAETVDRIKGLVVGGSSEVHVNGSFTEEFQIERGVRQGCPLAPLLFAMTTQPLMSALRAEERRGNIRGLNIGDGQTLLHQLFADDTGICITAEERQFETLKEVIKEFEMASGARLNLQKSIVMQLKPRQPPPWMEQSGCEIAVPGRNFRYLGVATSSPIDERAITEEIVQKMMKKLKHWSNRLLSWPAKTILLKHVLAATPLYQLLSVGLCRDGLEELEKLCRNFLWGWNEEGNPKHALIAWERLAQEKKRGGIGWTSFKVMADALNVRLMGRILEGGDAEWIHLARSFILRTLRRGSYQRECHQWSLQECLLLLPFTRVDGSPTLTRLLGSWFRARKKLQWNSVGGELDERMSILQVKAVYQIAERRGVGSLQLGRELGVLRRNRITTLAEAFQASRNGGWQQYLRQHGSYPEEETLLKLHNLEEWCMKQLVVRKDIMDLHGWSWEAQSGEFRWIRTTREWRTSFTKGKDFCEKLEEKWSRASQKLRWKERWKLLWSAPIAYRRKVWLWKILQRGFFTNHRAAEMGLQNGECSKCLDIPETLEHIMWMCSKTEERRRQLVALTVPERSATNLLEWIDVSLMRAQSSPASLIICILYCWTAWRERNEWQFCHKHVNRPVHSLLREVGLEVRAMENESKSEKRTRALELAKKEVLNWQSRWENLRRENRIS
ncbi:hypothetical protein R1sor_002320 [Riccia sorocarpa]|uniref:Reverse transcriptase domain-containing protein n=1 Tax=Riccia sorocarpa TaxID=122646 RepID=A0ABD3GYU3_9MARC